MIEKISFLNLLFFATQCLSATQVPALEGPVNDYAGVLSHAEKMALDKLLLKEELATGNQLVILTVKNLAGFSSIEELALKFFNTHQLGQKGRDNGILIVVSPEDRLVRIEVGYGFEGTLTDALCTGIRLNFINPRFKAGQYFQGLQDASNEILKILKTAPQRPQERLPLAHKILLFLIILGVLFAFAGKNILANFQENLSAKNLFNKFVGWLFWASLCLNLWLAKAPSQIGLLSANLIFLSAVFFALTMLFFRTIAFWIGLAICDFLYEFKKNILNQPIAWRSKTKNGFKFGGGGSGYSGGGGRSGGGGSSGGY